MTPASTPAAPRRAQRVRIHPPAGRRPAEERVPEPRHRARPNGSTNKAAPAGARAPAPDRLHYDRLDPKGRMTLRRAGRMHHLGIGAIHARKRVLALADDHQILITDLTTGEVLSVHPIEPE